MQHSLNNFDEVEYKNGLKLFFDKSFSITNHFAHKRKTRTFRYYKDILLFLKENPAIKVFFTIDEEIKSFRKISGGFIVNMISYQGFCKAIGSKTSGRAKAFLSQNLNINDIEVSETDRDNYIKVNASEKNIIAAFENFDMQTQEKIHRAISSFWELTISNSAAVQEGILDDGDSELEISRTEEIIKIPKNIKHFIEKLIAEDHGEEVWKELLNSDPNLATRLALARVQMNRSKSLEIFEQNLDCNNSDERFWQCFFLKNDWIFGYGLNYQFIDLITEQPNYGGSNFTGKGEQKGDYLANTNADSKFTVLVEIKTPKTQLLAYNKSSEHREIRNGVWMLSEELLGAVSQIQVNLNTWNRNSQVPVNAKPLGERSIFTVEPKGILIIGNTSEFEKQESKVNCFELFRRNLHNPEVLTFDEIYERAKFIVANQDQLKDKMPIDELQLQ